MARRSVIKEESYRLKGILRGIYAIGILSIYRGTFYRCPRECPEMSSKERSLLFVPPSVAGYLGALLLPLGWDVLVFFYFKKRLDYPDLPFFIALLLPPAGWFAFRFVQVVRSIHRYNGRREAHCS